MMANINDPEFFDQLERTNDGYYIVSGVELSDLKVIYPSLTILEIQRENNEYKFIIKKPING